MIVFFRFLLGSLFCFFAFSLKADLASDTVYLTWQQSPTTTMTIQWISFKEELTTKVSYCESKELEWKEVEGFTFPFPDSSTYFIHSLELSQLAPDTCYSFKINSSPSIYNFHTMPSKLEPSIQFVEGGDMYHDEMTIMRNMCFEAAKLSPDFALLGGDLAYAVNRPLDTFQDIERWIAWIKNWHLTMVTPQGHLIPVLAAIGNHDLLGHFNQTPKQAMIFSCLFPCHCPSLYRTVDFSSYLTLFLLDSGHANPIDGQQTLWLKKSLEERSLVWHKLAAYHVPAYPIVRPFRNKQSLAIRRWWVPLFEQGGIQLAFEHHDHIYKRTHPLLKNELHLKGIVYLGDGGWGIKKMRLPQRFFKKNYLAKTESVAHFIHVTLTANYQLFKCITHQGKVLDQWECSLNLSN